MTLYAALTPIEDCTAPFRVGTELDVSLWLSAVHVYNPRSLLFDSQEYADSRLPPTLHQAVPNAARPNLTFLRSRVASVKLDERPKEERGFGPSHTTLRVDEPLALGVGLRRLQQGHGAVPGEVGEPIAALGFLNASAHPGDWPARVRVDMALALDLEPPSPTFGTWRHVEQWSEGTVDVSNLGETVVIARLIVLRP